MILIFLEPHAEVDAWAKFFEVDHVALPDAHPGPSIKSGGACDALGVHAEADPTGTAPVVLGEGVAKEGEPQPAVPPRAPHSHDGDPSLAGERLTQGDACYLVAFHGQKPEGRIEALLLRLADEPLEWVTGAAPQVSERVLDGLVDCTLVPAWDEGADGDASGPVWVRWGLVEPGLHHVHPAHRGVACAIEEPSRCFAGRVDVMLNDDARSPGLVACDRASSAPPTRPDSRLSPSPCNPGGRNRRPRRLRRSG